MKSKNLKVWLLASAGVLIVTGLAVPKMTVQPGYANEAHGGHTHGHGAEESGEEKGHHDEEGVVHLDETQISAAGIQISQVGSGNLAREVIVPGKIIAASDRMAQAVSKVSGIVTEARKNLGDVVDRGETLAVIESREMADAVADYLAARRAEELARTVYNRESSLWNKKITAEQDFLNAKNGLQEAKIRLDLTRQKLHALGQDKAALKNSDFESNPEKYRFHEIRSLLSGRVIARELMLGESVDSTHALYTVADLSVVWVETAISPTDLPFVKEGQKAVVSGTGGKAEGKIIFISPVISSETRSAKAIIEIDNKDGHWRAGDLASAALVTDTQLAQITIPKDAIQTIEGQNVVFVRTDEGFEKRTVSIGKEDSIRAEIVSGLNAGEPIAITGTFTLKAELGKAEAGHDHDH